MLHSDAPSTQPAFSAGSLWPIAAGSLVAILGLAYGLRGGTQDREVISNQHTLSVSVHQLQQQVKDLSERLSALNALQEKRALVIEPEPKAPPRVVHQTKAVPSPKITNDLRALRQQLDEQSKRLAATRDDLDRANRDLESRLGSSIARTNEDLGALRQRGERDYHEFQLAKSKQYSRTGPVSLALRKADTKRKRYDIDLILDDVKLEKRNVNLYEPIAFRSGSQSLELVVNEVTKDKVKGYVSVPKSQQARF
ncbi:MAG: hypothetical protein JST93_01630 [Acidobacteria bacterium]|nr:hypothetical protein [Acidobacteriota bacterium]